METSKNRALVALIDLMTLVPAHRRGECKENCGALLGLVGEKVEDHAYLFGARPRSKAPMVTGDAIAPSAGARKFRFTLAIEHENSVPEPLVRGLTSMHELTRFAGKGQKTIETWMRDGRRTHNGVTSIPHTYLPGADHVLFFQLSEEDWRLNADKEPTIFQAIDRAKELPRIKKASRF